MSCNTFLNCATIGTPPVDQPAFATDTASLIIFIINAVFYILNAVAFIWLIYNLVKGILLMVKEDNKENFATARKVFTYSLFAGIGIIILQNAN